MNLTRIDEESSNDEGHSNLEPGMERLELSPKPYTPVESRPRPPTPLEDTMVGIADGIQLSPPPQKAKVETKTSYDKARQHKGKQWTR